MWVVTAISFHLLCSSPCVPSHLSGRRPFHARTPSGALLSILRDEMMRPSAPRLPSTRTTDTSEKPHQDQDEKDQGRGRGRTWQHEQLVHWDPLERSLRQRHGPYTRPLTHIRHRLHTPCCCCRTVEDPLPARALPVRGSIGHVHRWIRCSVRSHSEMNFPGLGTYTSATGPTGNDAVYDT